MTIKQELIELLRCPVCVREEGKKGDLTLHSDAWLVCNDCDRKYPILEDIPVMMIDEGDKWVETVVDDLPVPPPDMQ